MVKGCDSGGRLGKTTERGMKNINDSPMAPRSNLSTQPHLKPSCFTQFQSHHHYTHTPTPCFPAAGIKWTDHGG
ncbi:hypothetical protein L1987_06011 [Smallanthus sonchifolius]|uniref:Uncharacterized protein n=1 Tax=Smallanthus sonchifolius TaxID=185202 RepID=A0ACB9JWZ3_9ASTR|nr:hypothetical protein L1987_06011 [Smallanthus sonchifolius]